MTLRTHTFVATRCGTPREHAEHLGRILRDYLESRCVVLCGIDQPYTDVAYPGLCRITHSRDPELGEQSSDKYKSPVISGPTWLDVALFANAAIHQTRDYQHVLLEGIRDTGLKEDGEEIALLELMLGTKPQTLVPGSDISHQRNGAEND